MSTSSIRRRSDEPTLVPNRDLTAAVVSVQSPINAPVPGRIGPYRILGVLGAGGMGIVYRAAQDRPNRPVALKLMRPGLVTSGLLRRFEYEAEVLGRLQHEGIARIFEAGLDPATGQPFFAMELVEGLPLDEYARRNSLDNSQRLELLVRIAAAVHYAHQRGVVHRDLKPANILVSRDGQPKILDFGVARLTDADLATATMQTVPGQMVGTLAYMAPEQIVGRSEEVDTRSDVYALGVLCYELLSGRTPLQLKDLPLPEAARAVVEDEPDRLSRFDRTFRGDLETIVGKALSKEKERRYSTAAELAEDVQHYLRYEPIAARPASNLYYLRKFARRNKLLVGTAALAVFILVVGLFVTSWGLLNAERERRRAESAREISEITNDYLADAFQGVDPVHSGVGRPLSAVELLRHAAADLEKDQRFKDYPLEKASLQNHLGVMLSTLGHPGDGERLLRASLDLRKQHLGDRHSQAMISLNNLASVLKQLGRPGEAEPLFRETLDFASSQYSPDHPAILRAKKNLGSTLIDLHRFEEAERFLREAFEARERTMGVRHGDTMLAAIDLAEALSALDRPGEAEALLRPAIDALANYGSNDPDRLRAMQTLANSLQLQNKVQEAEPLFRTSFEGLQRLYGPDHPASIGAAYSYGAWLAYLRKPAEAEPLLRQAVRGNERLLGLDHPKTLMSKHALGNALASQRKLNDAEPVLREALAGRERVLGADHPDTFSAFESLAGVLSDAGNTPEAEALYERAIEGLEQKLGPNHPRTLGAIGNFAQLMQSQDRLAEAEALSMRVLEGFEETVGTEHPSTLISAHNLADIIERLGRQEEAETLYRRAAEGGREKLGLANPLTRQFAGRWCRALHRLGRDDEAAKASEEFKIPPHNTQAASESQPANRPSTGPA